MGRYNSAVPPSTIPAVGDKVTLTVTGVVKHYAEDSYGRIGTTGMLDNGTTFDVYSIRAGKVQVTYAPKPRPKVGDVITGRVLRDTMWKAGTVVMPVAEHLAVDGPRMLTRDGDWAQVNTPHRLSFDIFGSSFDYKVLVVGGE